MQDERRKGHASSLPFLPNSHAWLKPAQHMGVGEEARCFCLFCRVWLAVANRGYTRAWVRRGPEHNSWTRVCTGCRACIIDRACVAGCSWTGPPGTLAASKSMCEQSFARPCGVRASATRGHLGGQESCCCTLGAALVLHSAHLFPYSHSSAL